MCCPQPSLLDDKSCKLSAKNNDNGHHLQPIESKFASVLVVEKKKRGERLHLLKKFQSKKQ